MRNYVNELRTPAPYSGFQPRITEMLNGTAAELEKKTTTEETKWYVRCNSAEEDCYAIVKLTEDEYKAVIKFLNADNVYGGGFCGTCYIINHGFNTKEEALDAITTDTVWLYSE